jgi:hypothetical protein
MEHQYLIKTPVAGLHIERRTVEQVERFLDNIKPPVITPEERSGLIGLPLNKDTDPPPPKIVTTPPLSVNTKKPPKGRAVIMLKVLNGITQAKALDKSTLDKLSKIPSNLTGELLFRLRDQGHIASVKGVKPYRYYDPATEQLIACAARNGKQIQRDICNPNPQHKTCKACEHYHG